MKKHLSVSIAIIIHCILWFYLFEHSASVVMYFGIDGFDMPDSYISDGVYTSMFFNSSIFYLNYSYLVNKYMLHNLKIYLVISTAGFLLISFFETLVDIVQLGGLGFIETSNIENVLFSYNLKINLGYWLFAVLFKVATDWLSQQKRQKEIKQQQLETELAALLIQYSKHIV